MRKAITTGFVLMIVAMQINAQCSLCTPVFSNCQPGGGLCNKFDTAYAQSNYDQVINFFMPAILTEQAVLSQCSCSQVDLLSITIAGVSGLPAGVSYTLSNNGQYNVQGGDTVGCIHFCGIPLLPGLYPVTVSLLADVEAIGTPIGNVTENNVAQSYQDTLLVLPDTSGGVSSFTYGNNGSIACDSITVTLNAVLSAPSPNPTSYLWQLPGGQTSNKQSPGSFTFVNTSTVPDTFPITLTTTYYNFVIDEVYINSITGRYISPTNDDTYLCWGVIDSPDAYITFPSLGFSNKANYSSNTCSDIDFNDLGIVIPLGVQTVEMGMYAVYVLFPPDDSIGAYQFNVGIGIQNFSNVNADGWIEIDTEAGTTITETLNVIVNPTPPTPVVTASQDTFCNIDSVLISATASSYAYAWYQDTVLLLNETGSSFYTSNAGEYKVKITDANTGCANTSAFINVISEQTPQSPVEVVNVGSQLYVTPFSAGLRVNWYYNDTLVSGHSGAVIPYLGTGTYSAEVYNPAFPSCSVTASPVVVSGINDVYNADYNLNVLPNPNNGNFKVQFYSVGGQDINLNIRNVLGQLIYSRNLENFSGKFNQEINLEALDKGIYVVSVESSQGKQYRKIIVQ